MEHDERLDVLRSLPKVELHRHLEGAMRLRTQWELGRARRINLPLSSPEALAPFVTWSEGEPRSLKHFLTKFRGDWWGSYKDVERVVREEVEDAAREGVVHLELRFSPENLSRTGKLRAEAAMQAVAEAGQEAGEEHGVGVRYLVTLVRERQDDDLWRRFIDHAVALHELGVVGVDLAGDEFDHPNHEFVRAFERVRDTGVLGVTIHAGEGTSPEHVRSAVELLGAQRIGHGLEAARHPGVIGLLVEKKVALELCPVSNYQTGCVDDLSAHPLPQLDQAGVRVTLNADDPAIHRTGLLDNYDVAVSRWGYLLDDLLRLERNSVQAAFLDEPARAKLLEKVEAGYRACAGQGLNGGPTDAPSGSR
ncbi:MAG TPA: adenosine deaminase [Myxococcota bacterium]|nr:adenosine deaminase [Myxococcota bacterium]HRY93209.1 adenosine deaminase [Myxococcota bacterium]HSA22293.1 adenosine deaminase [Myxococcota bacterium]